MKKIALILAAALIFGCSADEAPTTTPPVADCNCDRVVEVSTFTIVGTPTNPTNYHSTFITINDCTQIQRSKTHNTNNLSLVPKIGECR